MMPGQEVRLKSSYIVRCTGCKKDEDGNVVEVYAEYDPLTLSGMPESNRKVKGTIHWVSARHSLPAEVRLVRSSLHGRKPVGHQRQDTGRDAEPGFSQGAEKLPSRAFPRGCCSGIALPVPAHRLLHGGSG